jgi:basic amino acid/polyamine antiporter, APA family
MNLLRTKSIEQSIRDTEAPAHALHRRLGALDLITFGVGVVIGTGIFVLTGKAAGVQAGPAVALSFVVSGLVCALAAICYAEFASTVPVAGSAYTFSYATLGELVAWIIGWDLILEMALGASTVAVGWVGYAVDLATSAHLTIPGWLVGEHHNLLAGGIVLLLTGIICLGITTSARVNAVIVAVKVAIVLFVIGAGAFYVHVANWSPFIPPAGSRGAPGATPSPSLLQDLGVAPGSFGISGIFTGAALVFFAYIGFDVVATAAEETRRPQRDIPIGILGSLAVCTLLYVAVSLVVTGMVRFDHLSIAAPLSQAFRSVGRPEFATVVSVGALAGLTTVMMILLLGQSRVFFAMSRDRLLPGAFSVVNRRTRVPVRTSLLTGVAVAALATLVPLSDLAELVNIGTLCAFVLVAAGIVVLRRSRPDLPRAFRVPLVPLLPALSVLASLYLMLNLPALTWLRFVLWMAVGLVVYALYGVRRSQLASSPARPAPGGPLPSATGGPAFPRRRPRRPGD